MTFSPDDVKTLLEEKNVGQCTNNFMDSTIADTGNMLTAFI